MSVSMVWTVTFGLALLAIFCAGRLLVGARGWRRLVYALAGVAALLLLRAAGLPVGVNPVTLAASALLGAPGAALSATLSFL